MLFSFFLSFFLSFFFDLDLSKFSLLLVLCVAEEVRSRNRNPQCRGNSAKALFQGLPASRSPAKLFLVQLGVGGMEWNELSWKGLQQDEKRSIE